VRAAVAGRHPRAPGHSGAARIPARRRPAHRVGVRRIRTRRCADGGQRVTVVGEAPPAPPTPPPPPPGGSGGRPPRPPRVPRPPKAPRRPPGPPRVLAPVPPAQLVVSAALALAAMLVLGFAINLMAFSPIQHLSTQQRLNDTFEVQLAAGTAPV